MKKQLEQIRVAAQGIIIRHEKADSVCEGFNSDGPINYRQYSMLSLKSSESLQQLRSIRICSLWYLLDEG